MSHTSTKIYRDTQASPVQGISIYDIQSVLGSSLNDIGALIVNGNINKWAKYKPVRYDTLGVLTDAQRKNVQHGLSTDVATETGVPTNSDSFFYKLLAGSLPWNYLYPRGKGVNGTNVNEWFRFLDFDGYDSSATPPMEPFAFSSVMLDYSNNLTLQWDVIPREAYELALSDMVIDQEDIVDWYMGVLLYHSSSGMYSFIAPTTIIGAGLSVTFENMASWEGKTVKMVPFLSKIELQQDTAVSNGKYISLFGLTAVDLEISRPSSGIYVYFNDNIWNAANTQISYDIEIENTTSSAKTMTLYISIVKGRNPASGDLVTSRTISNYSIAGNTTDTTTATGTFTGLTKDTSAVYWITISSLGSNVVPFQALPVEEAEQQQL